MKCKLCAAFLLITLFLSLSSCKQQKARWRGSIEEVDGITIVRNPKEPVYKKNVCVVEEELSIAWAEGRE
jgi:hypothetical protein